MPFKFGSIEIKILMYFLYISLYLFLFILYFFVIKGYSYIFKNIFIDVIN